MGVAVEVEGARSTTLEARNERKMQVIYLTEMQRDSPGDSDRNRHAEVTKIYT